MVNSLDSVFAKKDKLGELNNPGRPIAMCSPMRYQNHPPSSIVACCSSMGSISIVDTSIQGTCIKAQYDVYAKSNGSKISYTKGAFANRDIASGMSMNFSGDRIAVGGRERAAIILDIETGKQLWKVRRFET